MTRGPCVSGVLLLLSLAGCNTYGMPLQELSADVNASRRAIDVLIPGDRLEVRFAEQGRWDHQTTIGSEGNAPFLLLEPQRAAGLTLAELDAALTRAYREIIVDNEVSVLVIQRAPRSVAVLGAVANPGVHPIPAEGLTLQEALGLSGGQDLDTAHLGNLLLVRQLETGPKSWEIDARPEYWKSGELVWLEPHDMLYVPQKNVVHVDRWVDQYIRRMIPFPYLLPR